MNLSEKQIDEVSLNLTENKLDLDSMWSKNPEIIRQFISQQNDYEKLCAEVAYILSRELEKAKIEFSAITHRAKTLKSFLEKLKENPTKIQSQKLPISPE
jgi:ppGpp synthetase/RelA/SpoT-type nucleotidyltranferase